MDLGLTSGFDPPDLDTERDEAGLPRQDTPEGGSGTLQGRHQGTLHAGTRQTKQTGWGTWTGPVCMFITGTVGPMIKLCAGGGEGKGRTCAKGHH